MKTPQVAALPGMTPLGMKQQAERAAAKPLRPAQPQEPCDVGLFSDDSKQVDLIDLVRQSR
jgi:hypothetical protein